MWLKVHVDGLFTYHVVDWKRIPPNRFGGKLFPNKNVTVKNEKKKNIYSSLYIAFIHWEKRNTFSAQAFLPKWRTGLSFSLASMGASPCLCALWTSLGGILMYLFKIVIYPDDSGEKTSESCNPSTLNS